jgi:hypothetical protein
MSESLAAFRTSRSKDLAALAEEHMQHEYVGDVAVAVDAPAANTAQSQPAGP